MLFLLRKIRRKLMDNKKITSYLLYAIGEIILVVIGILIAVSLNNWNSEKKEKNRIRQILKEVTVELGDEIQEVDEVIDHYIVKDSLADRFFKYTLPSGKFDKDKDYRQITIMFGSRTAKLSQEALSKLIEQDNDEEGSLTDIVKQAKKLKALKDEIRRDYDRMSEYSQSHRQHLIFNTTWFSEFGFRNLTDEMINYFMNAPVYRNILKQYRSAMTGNYADDQREYRHRARILLRDIREYINDQSPNEFTYRQLSSQGWDQMKGEWIYQRESQIDAEEVFTYTFYEENEAYFLKASRQGASIGQVEVFFTNDSTFYLGDGVQFNLLPDGSIFSRTGWANSYNPWTMAKTNP